MAIGPVACSGSTDSTVHVSPPSITTQPANETVTAGQTATFKIVATGTAPLSYQWQKNGANIGGATSSIYTTPVTTAAGSGSKFDVMVSNSVASVTSNGATLTVNAAPTTALFRHVAIVVEENANYASVTSSSMPYLFGLMNQYGLATHITATPTPPSATTLCSSRAGSSPPMTAKPPPAFPSRWTT